MKHKFLIILTTFITAVIVTAGVGVVSKVWGDKGQPQTENVAANPTVEPAPVVDNSAAYQQLIQEANQTIEQANQQILQLSQPAEIAPTPTENPLPETQVSAEQAYELANSYAGGYPDALPVLVNFENVPAYEATYPNGQIYINAATGELIFNGIPAAPMQVTADLAVSLASAYMNSSAITGVTTAEFNGEMVYIVSFADGQKAYVNLAGIIVAIQMAPVYSAPAPSDTTPDQQIVDDDGDEDDDENEQEDHQEEDEDDGEEEAEDD